MAALWVRQNGAYSGAPKLRFQSERGAKITSPGRASQWHTKGGGRLVSLGGHQNGVPRGERQNGVLSKGVRQNCLPRGGAKIALTEGCQNGSPKPAQKWRLQAGAKMESTWGGRNDAN